MTFLNQTIKMPRRNSINLVINNITMGIIKPIVMNNVIFIVHNVIGIIIHILDVITLRLREINLKKYKV